MENDERTKVIKLCSEFLGNAWSEATFKDIDCQRLTSAIANHTYHCSIKKCVQLPKYDETEHKEVIVRINGHDLFELQDTIKFNGEVGEALTIHILSEYGLGPKLLGVFTGGVIVEYIPSRASTNEDWEDKELCAVLARKLAYLHTLSVPLSKKPELLEKVENVALTVNKVDVGSLQYSPLKREQLELVLKFPFEEEYSWIQSLVPKIGSKVVLSHNDLNPANILFKNEFTTPENRMIFIDFETSTYYFRGYDLAYFLNMKDLKRGKIGDKFVLHFERSNNDVGEVFIKEYLRETMRLKPEDVDLNLDTFDRLSMEVEFFELTFAVYNIALFRATIAAQPKLDIPFDIGVQIATEYAKKKHNFIQKYRESIYLKDVSLN